MQLIIGNKNYSSWSLRAWFLLKLAKIPFSTQKVWLDQEDFAEKISQFSAAGKVPILIDSPHLVWDSLSIVEYIHEKYARVYPDDAAQRVLARNFCAEIHSGFASLRSEMPMNLRAIGRKLRLSLEAENDLKRLHSMLALHKHNGETWFFGEFFSGSHAPAWEPISKDFLH